MPRRDESEDRPKGSKAHRVPTGSSGFRVAWSLSFVCGIMSRIG